MGFFKKAGKKAVRAVGIEPEGATPLETNEGTVDHRGQKGGNRTPAQKAGDKKRQGPRNN